MKRKEWNKGTWKRQLKNVLGLIVGNAIMSLGIVAFMTPQGIPVGGAAGIGLIVTHYSPQLNMAAVVMGVNFLLFAAGVFLLKFDVVAKTVCSVIVYPFFLEMFGKIPGLEQVTDNVLLAAIYGGLLMGLGIGIILRSGGSSGGTDTFALIVNKCFYIPVPAVIYVMEFVVLFLQAMFSEKELILFAVLTVLINTTLINRITVMGQVQTVVLAISPQYAVIREKLLKKVNVGITLVSIETGYGKEKQKAVLCVTSHRKLYRVKEVIQKTDPCAFVIVSQVNEVNGQGFTRDRGEYYHKPVQALEGN